VIIDIRPEYDGFICGVWQSLSDKTSDFIVSRQEREDMYNTVSLGSIRFMSEMLERLERQGG
jgi:phosphoserine aminotransferase